MEDQLWSLLYPLFREEDRRRKRRANKGTRFADHVILAVAFWAVLHDRPICWACQARHWPGSRPSVRRAWRKE